MTSAELLRAYHTPNKVLRTRSHCGKMIQLPFNTLRSLTTADGIQGRFKLSVSDQGKLMSISKL
ncbi:MAG: DUF2835 family protein [Gammaproteobacteria bacterium]|nr:DUF2835 family protein [Gammaproteobacteria bacterium]